MKALILRAIKIEKSQILKDRLKFLIKVLIYPIISFFNLQKINSKKIIVGNEKEIKRKRKNYVHYFLNKEKKPKDNLEILIARELSYPYLNINIRNISRGMIIWFIFISAAVYSFFDKTTISYSSLAESMNLIIKLTLLKDDIKEIYFFRLELLSIYFSINVFEKLKDDGLEIFIISSNIPLYSHRYTFLEKCNLILCSSYQKKELMHYINNNWFKIKSFKLWGLEEIHIYSNLEGKKPIYDIGLYSQGFWARNGIYRIQNIKKIKNKKTYNNIYYKFYLEIIEEMIKLKNYKDIKVKIYLHPYERFLYNNYNIVPPYYNKVKKADIDIDLSKNDSIKDIYNCKIGISLSSTIIFDRWHLGLEGYILDNEETNLNLPYNSKYLVEYQDSFFKNIDDLNLKILKNT